MGAWFDRQNACDQDADSTGVDAGRDCAMCSEHNSQRAMYGCNLSVLKLAGCVDDTLEEASALLKAIEARDSRQAPQVSGTTDIKQSSETSDELSSNTQSKLDRLEG